MAQTAFHLCSLPAVWFPKCHRITILTYYTVLSSKDTDDFRPFFVVPEAAEVQYGTDNLNI